MNFKLSIPIQNTDNLFVGYIKFYLPKCNISLYLEISSKGIGARDIFTYNISYS